MAENGNEYDEAYRQSCVYISANIQGDLERKKGVLGGKSKHYASLQGSTLYLQKKQGDVIETIDMQDVHHVRKITSEYTGTHFEISLKKKTHVFICPSSENCTAWVNALQTAMKRKNSSHHSSHTVDTTCTDDDKNLYSEVDEAFMSVSDDCNPLPPRIRSKPGPKLSDYTEPYDKECDTGKKDNDYWEVGDFRKSLNKSQLASESVHGNSESDISSCPATKQIRAVKESAHKLSANQIYDDAICDSTANTSSNQGSCTYDYAQVKKKKNMSVSQDFDEEVERISLPEIRLPVGSGVDIRSSGHNNLRSTETGGPIKCQASSEDSGLFQIISDALSDRTSPIKDYIHPLTEEDRKPLEELTDFLRNNVDVCRVSYSSVPINSDPVSSLKSYLGSLEISIRKSNNNIATF